MALFKEMAAKFLELLKRIPIAEDDDDDYVGRTDVGGAGGDSHNGFGLGGRGPDNDWGMSGRSGW
ncbi:hypothetical protein [Burkholderia sp. BE17]|uniref:hypothetical protein n=1 Tax=Burkholderia sp. BE17 TaxID=2656644 RepID=UPI00128C499F|nr:hypothetical protein [Burkholderia sp. BE17]MPV65588.1 hypothetical protein [Burkholderia sp. BE17]